jgi:hypothetical protein
MNTQNTNNTKEENIVRNVLKNEITWIIFILGILWGAVQGIVLPLQKVQIQISTVQTQLLNLDQMQMDISDIKSAHAVFSSQQATQDAQISAILSKLNLIK